MATRTIEECQQLVLLWMRGDKEKVIKELGGAPSDKFLSDFLPRAETPPRKKNLRGKAKEGSCSSEGARPSASPSLRAGS